MLRVEEIDRPVATDDQILVEVHTTTVNRTDCGWRSGKPFFARYFTGIRRPKWHTPGMERAGEVVAVGSAVTEFRIGDRVFGVKAQAIRDRGKLEPGQRVLVHGASGDVGTYAIQIAKAFGGEVTAVCGPRGVDIARWLGADVVVDYAEDDVTRGDRRFDLVIDIAGTRSFRQLRRVLARDAIVVVVGGKRANRPLGPLAHVTGSRLASVFSSQKTVFFLAKLGKADMEALRELLEAGKLRSRVGDVYPLDRLADALEHLGNGHPQGKIVVTL